MDMELTAMLAHWIERGSPLVTAVLDERNRFLNSANDLVVYLQNQVNVLQTRNVSLEEENERLKSSTGTGEGNWKQMMSQIQKERDETKRQNGNLEDQIHEKTRLNRSLTDQSNTMKSRMEKAERQHEDAKSKIQAHERSKRRILRQLEDAIEPSYRKVSADFDGAIDLHLKATENLRKGLEDASKRLAAETKRAEGEARRADEEAKRADHERKRAHDERVRADEEKARAEMEKSRADGEHSRANCLLSKLMEAQDKVFELLKNEREKECQDAIPSGLVRDSSDGLKCKISLKKARHSKSDSNKKGGKGKSIVKEEKRNGVPSAPTDSEGADVPKPVISTKIPSHGNEKKSKSENIRIKKSEKKKANVPGVVLSLAQSTKAKKKSTKRSRNKQSQQARSKAGIVKPGK